jgi:ABC-type glycerol-3-phosphate transport system permease component
MLQPRAHVKTYEDTALDIDYKLAEYTRLPLRLIQDMRQDKERRDAYRALIEEYDEFIREAPAIADDQGSIFAALWDSIIATRGRALLGILTAVLVAYGAYIALYGLGSAIPAHLSPHQ